MKKFKLWSGLGLVFIAIVTFSLSIFLAKPSDAVSVRNAQMIELGIIDEVKSAEDLGLGYLLRRPPELMANVLDAIGVARDTINAIPSERMDESNMFEVGTQRPVRTGQLLSDNGNDPRLQDLTYVGVVNRNGQAEGITPRGEAEMFTQEARGGGTLDPKTVMGFNNSGETLIADASGLFVQSRKVSVLDVLVLNKRTKKVYLVPNVIADTFCRDALNAVLTGRQRPHNINLNLLGRRRV
jgi:hypothetical protein